MAHLFCMHVLCFCMKYMHKKRVVYYSSAYGIFLAGRPPFHFKFLHSKFLRRISNNCNLDLWSSQGLEVIFLEQPNIYGNRKISLKQINSDDKRRDKSIFAQNLETRGKLKSFFSLNRVHQVSEFSKKRFQKRA